MENSAERFDIGYDQFILYTAGGILPPSQPGTGPGHEFVVYITKESLASAHIDADGMVEVTLREGHEEFESYGDGYWIRWHREYRAKFPHAYLVRRAVEAEGMNPFPHLPDPYEKPILDLTTNPLVKVRAQTQPITRDDFVNHIHGYGSQLDYWRREYPASHPIYRFVDIDKGSEDEAVVLAFIKLGDDYLEPDGWARFTYQKSLEYAASKRHDIRRHATMREVLELSKAHDIRGVTSFFALGTHLSRWHDRKHDYASFYPRMMFSYHRRSLDLIADDCPYGGRGEVYLAVVVNT